MKVLIVQSEIEAAQTLKNIFAQRGDEVFITLKVDEAIFILQMDKPNLMVLDLHLSKSVLFELLGGLRNKYPDVKVIITNRYPDLSRELDVKEFGVDIFLRSPFSKTWVEKALEKLEHIEPEELKRSRRRRSAFHLDRLSVRLKIILPYLFLSLLLAMGAGYVVSQVAIDSIEDRFVNNLIEIGKLTFSWLVEEENNRLETLRLLAFTDGLAESIIENDTEALRNLVLGLAINNQEEAIEILDSKGKALISVRHIPEGGRESFEYSKGDTIFTEAEFVQKVLDQSSDEQGDKFAGLIQASWGNYLYVAGPITDEDNQLIGVVLVGRSIPAMIQEAREVLLGKENSLAHISIYNYRGKTLGTTLGEADNIDLPEERVLRIFERQDYESQMRFLIASEIDYREILAPWEVRDDHDIGIVGVSLAESFLVSPSQQTQVQIYILATIGLLLIIGVGVLLSRRITQPLKQVILAASEVSHGKWDVVVEPQGRDELAMLAHTFNYMVSNLREGEIYRDMLGRTITPQVRDQMREGLQSGNLKIEGQNTIATIMITDIRRFTVISENESPTTILDWLNQYYGEIVPIINANDGVTSEFVGDSIMAYFGVLPIPLDPSESALQTCLAAVEILKNVKAMNKHRREVGIPPMVTGIGINTGEVAAGGIGTADRLHYSIIGDAVNITARIENLTKELHETSAIISQETYEALGDYRDNFVFSPLGSYMFKGKSEPIMVYRLLPIIVKKWDPIQVNINDAEVEDFVILEGIGAKIAKSIVEYRIANGDFSQINEIENVSGIGRMKFRQIKDHITISN
ncbi:MAG: helix-hairpin-helix domain-containing protein [Anaerolineales bacterium]|uniref:Helix-hairpin-helix domain-containing protein n=1 Tax=Candidatus Desulfolinea nitratireducens TaxID=2841698 RepID=A0A8J6NHD0_9CHLR|nr:helix-hairpin-helix domain-containing protein [Candidatus Desulfolinea nitratireducens]MBL6959731.1 helix-hairpin-helix domain-containing protein [Anaerolineales bacterium]